MTMSDPTSKIDYWNYGAGLDQIITGFGIDQVTSSTTGSTDCILLIKDLL